MLTVDQIKNISFKRGSLGGYKCDEVDSFIDEVAATVEDLKKKNAEIIAKSELLMKKVEEMRSNEDSVSQVLVKAQKESDRTLKEAKKTAAGIIRDAKAEADRIIADANGRIIKEKEMIVQIEEEAAEIRKKLIENFEHQIESLKVLPEKNEAKELKKSLDERYPTESYNNSEDKTVSTDNASSEEGFATIEEAVEDATAATESSANAEAAAAEESEDAEEAKKSDKTDENKASDENDSEKDSKDSKDGIIQIDKSKFENRFGKLKFGDDYDVKKDQ